MSDEQESNVSSDPLEEFGFDIVYDAEQDMYILKRPGEEDEGLFSEPDYDKWQENYKYMHDLLFSQKTKFITVKRDLLTCIQNGDVFFCANYKANTVTLYVYTTKPEDYEKCIHLMQKEYDLSAEDAQKVYQNMTNPDRLSYLEHEMGHFADDKKSTFTKYDLPPEYMARLNMITEIHANMEQAGLALDMYKATGDLKYFDNLLVDTEEIKEALRKNPNMENPEKFISQHVLKKWLEKYNKEDSAYDMQAYLCSSPDFYPYPLWALTDNPEAQAEYNRRVNKMFKYVAGLGDVTQYVDLDFKLNEPLKTNLQNENVVQNNEYLRAMLTQDAHNAREYSQNLLKFLGLVKEVDADGIRTPEEQERLNTHLRKSMKKSAENSISYADNSSMSARQRQSLER